MRIPKFRAFRKDYKKMCIVLTLIINHKQVQIKNTDVSNFPFMAEYLKMDEVILMQSTGYKDKNGTEIFEGDILKIVDIFDKEKIGEVIFQGGCMQFYTPHESLDLLNEYVDKDIEVIGNIYEIDYEKIKEKWNNLEGEIRKIWTLNDTRKRRIKARIKEVGEKEFIKTITGIKHSKFLQGQNSDNWVITFDWFIKHSNFRKVYEGEYKDKEEKKG